MNTRQRVLFFVIMVVILAFTWANVNSATTSYVFLPLIFAPQPTSSVFLPLLFYPYPTPTLPPTLTPTLTPTVTLTSTPEFTLTATNIPAPQWVNLKSQSIVSIVTHPTIAGAAYSAVAGIGIAKTIDGGQHWNLINSESALQQVNILAINPENTHILYAGTDKQGFFRSVDDGYHWTMIGQNLQGTLSTYAIAFDPTNSRIMYLGTRGLSNNNAAPWSGIMYKSLDGGINWQPILQDVGGAGQQDWVYSIAINQNPGQNQVIFVATHEHGPYLSRDAGATWQPLNNGMSDLSGRSIVIDPRSTDPMTAYFATWHRVGVYKTTNSGANWALKPWDGLKTYSMILDSQFPDRIYLATFSNGFMRSWTAGESWEQSLNQYSLYAVAIDAANRNHLYAGTVGALPGYSADGGMFISNDAGHSWNHSLASFSSGTASVLLSLPGQSNTWLSAVDGGTLKSSQDGGNTWNEVALPAGSQAVKDVVLDPQNQDWFYVLTDTGGLIHASLQGQSSVVWNQASGGAPYQPQADATHPFASVVARLAEDDQTMQDALPTNPNTPALSLAFAASETKVGYLGTSGAGIWRTVDGGQYWQAAGLDGQVVWNVSVDPANPNLVIAATHETGVVMVSMDGGAHWTKSALPVSVPVYAVQASSGNQGTLIAATADGIWRLRSGKWIRAGLDGQTVTVLAHNPLSPQTIWAGTAAQGAFSSTDGGVTWQSGPQQLGSIGIRSIHFDPNSARGVFFGTLYHGGLWVK